MANIQLNYKASDRDYIYSECTKCERINRISVENVTRKKI